MMIIHTVKDPTMLLPTARGRKGQRVAKGSRVSDCVFNTRREFLLLAPPYRKAYVWISMHTCQNIRSGLTLQHGPLVSLNG